MLTIVGMKRLTGIGWLLIAILVLVGSSAAHDTMPTTLYTTEVANLRECPHLTCVLVAELPRAAELLILNHEIGDIVAESDQWLLVEDAASNTKGYIHISLTSRYQPDTWKMLPVIPQVTATARQIYQRGQELGNNPNAFSVVGDCQNVNAYFLSDFEKSLQYNLGQYNTLQETIDYFKGSFGRERAAVRGGYNVASVLSPMWADPEQCKKGENPLSCEYRLQHPSFVIISMETWWEGRPTETYEQYLRQVVDFWVEQGVVPILGTKADNLEGNNSINASIATVARDYDIPLWNFWLAVQSLPTHGLSDDAFHLTYGRPFFNDTDAMQTGWAMRNLTALQVLDTVRRSVLGES